jgi:hypothetical protein
MYRSRFVKFGLVMVLVWLIGCTTSTPTTGPTAGPAEFVYYVTTEDTPVIRVAGPVFEAPTDNCGNPADAEETLRQSHTFSIDLELELSQTIIAEVGVGSENIAYAKLGAEVEHSLGIKIGATKTVEAERKVTTKGNSRTITKLQWEGIWSKGTVSIERADGTPVGKAPFLALTTLRLTQLSSDVVTCTPEPAVTPVLPTSATPPTPKDTPQPNGWSVVYDFSESSLDPGYWDLDSPAYPFVKVTRDGRLYVFAENTTDQWMEWGLFFRATEPFVRAEAEIDLVRAEGGPAGFGISGFTVDLGHCFHFNPWANDRDDDPPKGLGYAWVGETPPGNLDGCWSWDDATVHAQIPWTEALVQGRHTLQVHLTGSGIEFIRDGDVVDTAPLEGDNNLGGSLMVRIRLNEGGLVEGYLDNLKVLYESDAP